MAHKEVKKTSTIFSGESKKYTACETEFLLAEYKAQNRTLKNDLNSLQELKIQLIHEVPQQHKIEADAGTRHPTHDEKRRIQKYVVIKRGIFSPDEDRIISKNWKKFCKIHNWDRSNVKPFMFMRHDYVHTIRSFEERKKFVQFLANKLPNRTLYSVYQRFRNLNSSHFQKRYTHEDDEIILQHIERNLLVDPKNMFSDLAKILNRTRASVWRRYRLLKKRREEDNVIFQSIAK